MKNQPFASAPTALVVVRNVSKTFVSKGKPLVALDDMSLQLEKGEFVSLIGPSGCGKSTLLNVIGGLDVPSSGEVLVEGERVHSPLPNKIGIVFQDYSLLPWRTTLANINLALEFRGVREPERSTVARAHAAIVGMGDFLNYYPHELSGGMKQRVAMARSLALGCKVLLMDEPFGALDEQTRMQMSHELTIIHQRIQGTILLVTHSIEESIALSDRVIVMSARPGKTIDTISIPFPHPRTAEVRKSGEFNSLRERLWEIVSSQWGGSPAV